MAERVFAYSINDSIDVNQVTSLDFVDSDLKIYPDIKKYIIKNEK